jgi:hypothetical protein
MIFLKDVLETMEQTDKKNQLKPFSIVFVTADRNKKTGGDIIEIERATILKRLPGEKKAAKPQANKSITKTPNHWDNSTRNILLPNGQKRKIHIRLITRFNNQPVIY